MHIPDGYLSLHISIPACCVSIPLWFLSIKAYFKNKLMHSLPAIASLTAFAFIIQTIMIPIPGGTSAHIAGCSLIGIIYNPFVAFICETMVLLIQSLFFGMGGITVLPVNAFILGFAGPACAYFAYKLICRFHQKLALFTAGCMGITVSAVATALILGLQHMISEKHFPLPITVVLPAIAIPHLTVFGIIEGIYTLLTFTLLGKVGALEQKGILPAASGGVSLFVAAGFSLRQKMTECGCLSSPLQAAGHSGIFCKINQHALFLFFYIVIIFTISSMTDYLILTGIFIIAMIVFYRDAVSMLKKTVLLIAPFSIVLTVATLIYGIINNIAQLDLIISFNIRSLLITFLTFNFIRRVNLFEAFGFSKLFITIISIAMGQISTYRRLINDFYLGLKSRMLKKPSLTKTLRASSGITGSLLNLSLHHSREVADALKSRGVDY